MSSQARIKNRLTARIIFPLILLVLFLGLGLYAFVLRSVAGFERDLIQEDLGGISRGIFSILDEEYYQLLVSGNAAQERLALIAKGHALGRVEDYIRQRNVRASVFLVPSGEPLLVRDLPEDVARRIWYTGAPNRVLKMEEAGERLYAYHFQFEPWEWQVVFSKGVTGYATLLSKVRIANAATAAALLVVAVLFYYIINRHIAKPLRSIIDALSQGKHPRYRGIHEFQFLSDSIHSMMHSLEDNAKWIDTLLSTVGALIIVTDPEGVIVQVNRTFERITGFENADIAGRRLWDFLIPHTSVEAARRSFWELLEKKVPTTFEGPLLTSAGEEIAILWTNTVITGDDGDVRWIIATGINITQRIRAEEELEDREQFLVDIFDSIQDGISILDEEMNVVRVNPTMKRWYAHSMPLTGRKCWEVFRGGNSICEDCPSQVTLQTGRTSFSMVPLIGPGKEVRGWLELYSFPFVDRETGRLKGVIEYVRDVTDRKRAEEKLVSSLQEKEVLLKEIHHRVKNNLQVISGLLGLQAHHITDPKALGVYKESQNRVVSMALIHEELYQSRDLAQVNFGDYVRNLGRNLLASYGVERDRVELIVEAEDLDLVVDTAIPCGLVINELVSNSLKHAFPDGRKGWIRIGFQTMEDDGYRLTVADNGVGLPEDLDFGDPGTLGMQLVKVLLEQMGATIDLSREGGTSFEIRFKEYHEAGTELH